jgi:Mg2+-importing ATPase
LKANRDRSGLAPASYWNVSLDSLEAAVKSNVKGLTADDARERLRKVGPNTLETRRSATPVGLLLGQFKSPLILILIFAAVVSAFLQEWVDAAIVISIVLGSAILTFIQEYRASNAIEKLRSRLTIKASVLRDGQIESIPASEVVPGDVAILSAGSLIPADGIVFEAKDFFVNQASLTGESFPVEKNPGAVAAAAGLSERTNVAFMGTNVRSGSARVLIVNTGRSTAYGQIAQRLTLRPPETEFEHGIHHFGYLLTQIMMFMVVFVFAINLLLHRPLIESLLFSVALAVGLAPELLPAVISLNLSRGAQVMAKEGVLVRRLSSIQNFGSMDVLCTDKTGTLTEGVVKMDAANDFDGHPSEEVFRYAYLNSAFQTGLANALDEAIVAQGKAQFPDLLTSGDIKKLDEIPFDFVRKRLTVVVEEQDATRARQIMTTKGALDKVLEVCAQVRHEDRSSPLDLEAQNQIQQRYQELSRQGFRVLGVATKEVPLLSVYTRNDEHDLSFLGFLLFFDPPKKDVREALEELDKLGVQVKVITGDNRLVSQHVAEMVGMRITGIVTGRDMAQMTNDALRHAADTANVFAEVDPSDKERIIQVLKHMGHVVGFMGDGINDAPALYAADVGISVDSAVDVAKEAADLVLLEPDLEDLRRGIILGRKTFSNTMKYIFTTISANFGNMFSMAASSLFLPFLPLLAKQILLNNFLSDFPALTIATDNVDAEMIATPPRWDLRFIRNFMIVFGLVSSIFDFLTFGLLLWVFRTSPEAFRTGWFIESLMTELFIALVVRTRRSIFRSRPGKYLFIGTLTVAGITVVIPYLPFAEYLGFTPLPATIMFSLGAITVLYMVASEIAKKVFYIRASKHVVGIRTHRG